MSRKAPLVLPLLMGTTCGVVVGLVEEGAIVEEGAVISVVGEGTVEDGAVGAAFKVGAVGWGCLGVGSCGGVKDHVASSYRCVEVALGVDVVQTF